MINFGGVYHCVISVVGVTSDCCEEAADDDLEEHEETSEMVDCEDGELDLKQWEYEIYLFDWNIPTADVVVIVTSLVSCLQIK